LTVRRAGEIASGALLVALGGCCGPQVKSVNVTPAAICAGERADVKWDAAGELTLMTTLKDPRLATATDGVDVSGEPAVVSFRLVSKGEPDKPKDAELDVYPATAATTLVFATAPAGNPVVARGTKAPAAWNSRFEVTTVTAAGRDVVVVHEGRQAALKVGAEPVKTFEGTAVGGDWELRATLTAAELADPKQRPGRLGVQVGLRCKPAAR